MWHAFVFELREWNMSQDLHQHFVSRDWRVFLFFVCQAQSDWMEVIYENQFWGLSQLLNWILVWTLKRLLWHTKIIYSESFVALIVYLISSSCSKVNLQQSLTFLQHQTAFIPWLTRFNCGLVCPENHILHVYNTHYMACGKTLPQRAFVKCVTFSVIKFFHLSCGSLLLLQSQGRDIRMKGSECKCTSKIFRFYCWETEIHASLPLCHYALLCVHTSLEIPMQYTRCMVLKWIHVKKSANPENIFAKLCEIFPTFQLTLLHFLTWSS